MIWDTLPDDLSVKEVMEILNRSRRTVRDLIDSGKLLVTRRVGNAIAISKESVHKVHDELVKSGKLQS